MFLVSATESTDKENKNIIIKDRVKISLRIYNENKQKASEITNILSRS